MNYEQFAWYYDSLMDPKFYEAYASYLRHHLSFHRVLDLGCGTGTMAEQLIQSHEQYVGIDLSESMIAIAQERHEKEHVQFLVGDMCTCAYPPNLDAVLCLCDSINYLLSF